jgi:hypothetical protein
MGAFEELERQNQELELLMTGIENLR